MIIDTPYVDFAHAIIRQAVVDWRALCKGEDAGQTSFVSLRRFFQSEWCTTLCLGVKPLAILDRLEEELVQFQKEKRI